MKFGKVVVAAVLGGLVLGACSSNDELIASKDQAITEKNAENDKLKKQLADAESARLVAQKSNELKMQAEQNRLREEAQAKPVEPPPTSPAPESEAPAGKRPKAGTAGGSPASVVKVKDPDIEVETRSSGDVALRLNAKELFAPGSADLTPGGQKVLSKVADNLKKYPDFRISVEGHTDDTPLKKTAARWKNNLNLSIARAISVRQYLNQKGHIEDGRMSVVGFGDTKPLVPNKDESARAKNRRVEVVLCK